MARSLELMTRSTRLFRYSLPTPSKQHKLLSIAPQNARHLSAAPISLAGQYACSCRYDGFRTARGKVSRADPTATSSLYEWSTPAVSRCHKKLFSSTSLSRAAHQQDEKDQTTSTQQAPEQGAKNDAIAPKAIPNLLKKLAPVELHENIYTLPNILTTTRIITAPIISYALLHSQPVLAFTLFAYSSITDLVDGFLARRYNMGTVLGSILDPFADKLLMTLTTISLYAIGTFPWWLALIILGRDGGLLLSALYFRWISLPHPRTMKRYWDFSLPSAEVRPTEISKINTLLQFLLVADAVLLPVLPVSLVESLNLWGIFEGWMGLVAGTTIWSGLSYFFAKDAIRFIGQDQKKK